MKFANGDCMTAGLQSYMPVAKCLNCDHMIARPPSTAGLNKDPLAEWTKFKQTVDGIILDVTEMRKCWKEYFQWC